MVMDQVGRIVRELRKREGVSQESLARRAGTTQAVVSRIERGEASPTLRMLGRLLLVLGYEADLTARELEREHDPVHLAEELRLRPEERLERAFAWGRFNEKLHAAASRATR